MSQTNEKKSKNVTNQYKKNKLLKKVTSQSKKSDKKSQTSVKEIQTCEKK